MNSDQSQNSESDRLDAIVLEYLEACEAGQSPDRDAMLAEYPELEEELTLFFRERDRMERFSTFVRGEVDSEQADRHSRGLPSPPLMQRGSLDSNQTSTSSSPHSINGQLGDFRLIQEVGRGGMGIVYEAMQISLNRRVALKVLPFASALDERHLQRFKNEAAAAAHLDHKNIVTVYSVGCERGVHFYTMQFIEGQSLSAYLTGRRQAAKEQFDQSTMAIACDSTSGPKGKQLFFDWVAKLGQQAALALEHAHQTGVIHRDIKPANLLLDTRGHLWITDFGLARFSNDAELTMTGELLGTLRYSSPEQQLGKRGIVDHRTDIYSLGATMYELLAMRPPFDSQDRNELIHQIAAEEPPPLRGQVESLPPALETIILKTLRKTPSDRYDSAQELADDLQRYLDRQPIVARPPRITERFLNWTRKHPSLSMGTAILLLCISIGSIATAILVGAERERTQQSQRRAELAYHRERERAEEAELRLRLARRAIDEFLVIDEEELANRPELLLLRKRVLQSALAFYQEFLSERSDDPLARAELLETTERVQRILTDLELLRSATHFYLLCQPDVLSDLGVTNEQRPRLKELTDLVGTEWRESFSSIGKMTLEERTLDSLSRARKNEASLKSILTSNQQSRLRQLRLQSEGPAAFRDPEVIEAVRITPEQLEEIRLIEDSATYGWLAAGSRFNSPASRDRNEQLRRADDQIMDVLTPEQQVRWRELTGEPLPSLQFPFQRRYRRSLDQP